MTRLPAPRLLLALTLLAAAIPAPNAHATIDGVWGPIPQARSNQAEMLAADPIHQRVFRFGGANETATNTLSELIMAPTPHWVDLLPTGARPPVRAIGSLIYDAFNDRLVLFGGEDFPVRYNDVWTFDLAGPPHWELLTPAGVPPSPRSSHSAIYDPIRQRMVIFAGDLWELSLSGIPTWAPLASSGIAPLLSTGGSAVYDPVGDRMLVFGGSPGIGLGTNTAYELTLAGTPTWSELSTVGARPAPRFDQAMALDATRRRLIVHGGWAVLDPFNPQPFRVNDTWSLDLSVTPSPWSRIDGGVGPVEVPDREAYVDFDGSRLVLAGYPILHTLDFATSQWGAFVPGNTGPVNRVEDLHSGPAFDPVTGRTYLFAGGQLFSTTSSPVADWIAHPGGPGPRFGSCLVLDAARRRLLLIGGRTSASSFEGERTAETWAFSLEIATWDGAPFAVLPFRVEKAAAVADPANDRVLLYGGQIDTPPDPASTFSTDVWQLSLANATWQRLKPFRAPGQRYHAAMVADADRGRFLVYSGQGANGEILSELWALKIQRKQARWTQLASAQPAAAAYPSAAMDPGRQRLLVTGVNPANERSQIQAYELVTDAWSTLAPPGNIPRGRTAPAVWFDAAQDRLLVYGGVLGLGESSPGQIWGLSFGDAAAEPSSAGASEGSGWQRGGVAAAAFPSRLLSANPLASDRLELSLEARGPGDARVEMFDIAGRVVASAARHLEPGAPVRVSFDTRSLAPGLYLVRVSDGMRQGMHRVVIAH